MWQIDERLAHLDEEEKWKKEKRSKVQLSTFEGGLFVPHVNFHHDWLFYRPSVYGNQAFGFILHFTLLLLLHFILVKLGRNSFHLNQCMRHGMTCVCVHYFFLQERPSLFLPILAYTQAFTFSSIFSACDCVWWKNERRNDKQDSKHNIYSTHKNAGQKTEVD